MRDLAAPHPDGAVSGGTLAGSAAKMAGSTHEVRRIAVGDTSCVSTSLTSLFADACEEAAAIIPPRLTSSGNQGGPTEQQLEDALFDLMPRRGVAVGRLGARRLKVAHDWEPLPRGLDFYVWHDRVDGPVALVSELKFDEVQQRLWDLLKVLAARKLPGEPATLLVHGGDWRRPRPCSAIFPAVVGRTAELQIRDLVHDSADQWRRDLQYPGRVTVAPEVVRCTAMLAGVRLAHHPAYELRIAKVEPAGADVIKFTDGWPVCYAKPEER